MLKQAKIFGTQKSRLRKIDSKTKITNSNNSSVKTKGFFIRVGTVCVVLRLEAC